MTNLLRKVSVGVAIGSLFASVFATAAFADTTIDILGNGEHSHNSVNVTSSDTTKVGQSNSTNVSTNVNSSANTGGNNANDNTGGNVSIDTGKATSDVSVTVSGSSNTAQVSNCGCDPGNVDVTIAENGEHSSNKVKVKLEQLLSVTQKNHTYVDTWVWSRALTGKNKANGNTGGPVLVDTGKAHSTVDVHVFAPSNTLNP